MASAAGATTTTTTAAAQQAIVFGASGVVGQAIVRLLSDKVKVSGGAAADPVITAVSRSDSIPSLADLPGVCCKTGDLTDMQKTVELCEGKRIIYGAVGLPYNSSVWQKQFPVVIDSLLKAAEATGAVLVWVDNLYMFGPEAAVSGIPMKESSREFTQHGRKPAVRSLMDKGMLEAAESGRCKVALVRASDFYGPGVKNANLGENFFRPFLKGGRVTLLGNPKKKHAYTYVPDLARAVVAVAEAGESAWGRAWHCPNAPAETTNEIVQKVAGICGDTKPPKITVISGMRRKILGLFIAPLREMSEIAFVWDNDYLVDHSEFSAKFPELLPTPIDEGLRDTVEWWRTQKV